MTRLQYDYCGRGIVLCSKGEIFVYWCQSMLIAGPCILVGPERVMGVLVREPGSAIAANKDQTNLTHCMG